MRHRSSKMKCVCIIVVLVGCFVLKSEAVCQKLYGRGVSAAEKKVIVDRHNAIRLSVARHQVERQPKASNMKRLSWDNALASAAQRIAETCVFEHVRVTDSRFSVGQNLYWASSTAYNKTADWSAAINAWFEEYKTYTFGAGTYNHYTQVVWATTKYIGCGLTFYQNKPGWYDKLYVCNYGPAGNFIGQAPYKTGAGCENLC